MTRQPPFRVHRQQYVCSPCRTGAHEFCIERMPILATKDFPVGHIEECHCGCGK